MANDSRFQGWVRTLWPIVVVVGGMILTVVVNGKIMCTKVDNINEKEIPALKETDKVLQDEMDKNCEKIEEDIDRQDAQFHMQNEAIIKLQSDVAYIKEGIDDIKGELRGR